MRTGLCRVYGLLSGPPCAIRTLVVPLYLTALALLFSFSSLVPIRAVARSVNVPSMFIHPVKQVILCYTLHRAMNG